MNNYAFLIGELPFSFHYLVQFSIMMGNDDASVNMDVLEHYPKFHTIHGKRLPLSPDLDIVGYSCVPILLLKLKIGKNMI